jgi:hypothetical protein
MKRRIILYFFSALLISLIGFVGIEISAAQPVTYQHYTDIAGFDAISKAKLITGDSKGRVYLTPNEYSEVEAFNALFIGNPKYKGKGTHVFKLKMNPDVKLVPGTQPNEVIFEGTLRFDKHATVAYSGINPKK